jgi:arabinose-5-phosphate isomerase
LSQKTPRSPRDIARWVLEIEADAIRTQLLHLDENFDRAVALLCGAKGRAVCSGMGKSGLIMKKVAATLASTGTPSFFLHPAEAIHGDLGMVVEGDVVIAASYSGRTQELLRLVELLKRLGVPMIILTGDEDSPLANHADVHLPVVIDKEACPLDLAPTASTTATLALCDALAMALLETRGFTPEDFARFHPGGGLGKKLRKVEDVMQTGADLPKVDGDASLRDAIFEMSGKRLGITAVTDKGGRLIGCVSDGDLRRLLAAGDVQLDQSARESMHSSPRVIGRGCLASLALKEMEDHRITSLFVCDEENVLEGAVHIHDLWRLDLF